MHRYTGNNAGSPQQGTRRDVLKTGVVVGLGLGAVSLTGVRPLQTIHKNEHLWLEK